ncbi:MAG: LysR family transcriptional regulator ArgP [Proteobacteria bacterium]|nr:LysR family transcriptional regulator ArgP [Pseudomonadota bacterium]MBU1611073.1 LysR family transcriptional regulator ArgP [Pseudomonadota bacterium]
MLDYKLVEALAMVVREGGFEKAARAMHLTQSAVSQRVKLLEDQTGQVLLVRSTPPQATGAGSEVLKHYRQVERLEGDLAEAMAPDRAGALEVLPIGVNADSLSTWFLDAVRPILRTRKLLLDLSVDDQEQTHNMLKRGEVVGCVSARVTPVQGCLATCLGRMVYRLLATPGFVAAWFADGFTPEAARIAPAVIFDRKDDMHNKVLVRAFGEVPGKVPTHYIPSSEKFLDMVVSGFGYGMVPDYQSEQLREAGALIDVAPGFAVPVDLYWHCWNIGSPLLEEFSKALFEHAWMVLANPSEETGPFGPV